MIKELNIEFEKATRLLAAALPVSTDKTRKPVLFHDIRVGVYLYENDYKREIVLAGLLHDALEFSTLTAEQIVESFGSEVLRLVKASTKDDSITDKTEKTNELIQRCVANGEDALIVKAADVLDSFKFYSAINNSDELAYCSRNASAIFAHKPDLMQDKIFDELRVWHDRYPLK